MSYNFYRVSIEQELSANSLTNPIGAVVIGLKLRELYGAIIVKGLDLKYENKRSKEYNDYFHFMDFYISNNDNNQLNYSLKTNKKFDIILSSEHKWIICPIDVSINLLDGSALSITTQFNYKNKNIRFDDKYTFAPGGGLYRDEYTFYHEITDDDSITKEFSQININASDNLIQLDIRTIPEWLHNSELYLSVEIDEEDETTYIFPIRQEFITNINQINNNEELFSLIPVMKFWGIKEVPWMIFDYIVKHYNIRNEFSHNICDDLFYKDLLCHTDDAYFQSEILLAAHLEECKHKKFDKNVITKICEKITEDGLLYILKYRYRKFPTMEDAKTTSYKINDFETILFETIIRLDSLTCLKYVTNLFDNTFGYYNANEFKLIEQSIIYNSNKCFEYMVNILKWKCTYVHSISAAICFNRIDKVKYVYENRKKNYYDYIARIPDITGEIKYEYCYLRGNSCPIMSCVVEHAIYNNDVTILNYMISLNMPISIYTMLWLMSRPTFHLTHNNINGIKKEIFTICIDTYIIRNIRTANDITNLHIYCIEHNFTDGINILKEKGLIENNT